LQRCPDSDEVLEGLGHFEAIYAEVAAMQPVIAPLFFKRCWNTVAWTQWQEVLINLANAVSLTFIPSASGPL
jgi:hypothetical protein